MVAILLIDTHSPWPEHGLGSVLGHAILWHASPVKPAKHLHTPLDLSQRPMLLHSACACAVVVLEGMSTQAFPAGHVRFEQSGDLKIAMSLTEPQPS